MVSGSPAAVTQHDFHDEVGDGVSRLIGVQLGEHVTRVVRRSTAELSRHEPEQSAAASSPRVV